MRSWRLYPHEWINAVIVEWVRCYENEFSLRAYFLLLHLSWKYLLALLLNYDVTWTLSLDVVEHLSFQNHEQNTLPLFTLPSLWCPVIAEDTLWIGILVVKVSSIDFIMIHARAVVIQFYKSGELVKHRDFWPPGCWVDPVLSHYHFSLPSPQWFLKILDPRNLIVLFPLGLLMMFPLISMLLCSPYFWNSLFIL